MDARIEKRGSDTVTPPAVLAEPRLAKYAIGQVVRHRHYPFRGVIFDVDPTFSNTEQWWLSIPEEIRPRKDQPFYHLLAENEENAYVAYVSEQNLVDDDSGAPVRHPRAKEFFRRDRKGRYTIDRAGLN